MYVLHRVNRRSLRLCCRPDRTQRWNKRYIDTDLVTLGRIKGTTNIRAKMHAKDTNPGTSTLTNIGSPFSCSLTKIPLPQPERYDSLLSGEAATTGSKFRVHVFAPGRQDILFIKSLNRVIRSTDMCVAPLHQSPDLGPCFSFPNDNEGKSHQVLISRFLDSIISGPFGTDKIDRIFCFVIFG